MDDTDNEVWAVVSLFGHNQIAGRITKDTSLFPLLRVDVPATEQAPAHTVEYGPGAIFEILYVSKEIALVAAARLHHDPVAICAPELVTRADYEDMRKRYQAELSALRAGLPAPATPSHTPEPIIPDLEDDPYGDGDDYQDDEE